MPSKWYITALIPKLFTVGKCLIYSGGTQWLCLCASESAASQDRCKHSMGPLLPAFHLHGCLGGAAGCLGQAQCTLGSLGPASSPVLERRLPVPGKATLAALPCWRAEAWYGQKKCPFTNYKNKDNFSLWRREKNRLYFAFSGWEDINFSALQDILFSIYPLLFLDEELNVLHPHLQFTSFNFCIFCFSVESIILLVITAWEYPSHS